MAAFFVVRVDGSQARRIAGGLFGEIGIDSGSDTSGWKLWLALVVVVRGTET